MTDLTSTDRGRLHVAAAATVIAPTMIGLVFLTIYCGYDPEWSAALLAGIVTAAVVSVGAACVQAARRIMLYVSTLHAEVAALRAEIRASRRDAAVADIVEYTQDMSNVHQLRSRQPAN